MNNDVPDGRQIDGIYIGYIHLYYNFKEVYNGRL